MNKIKIDVITIIEDEESGKKTKKQKTMHLDDFVNMVCQYILRNIMNIGKYEK